MSLDWQEHVRSGYLNPQQFVEKVDSNHGHDWEDTTQRLAGGKVEEYRERIRAGEAIRPIEIASAGVVVDGHHRAVAHLHEQADLPVISYAEAAAQRKANPPRTLLEREGR